MSDWMLAHDAAPQARRRDGGFIRLLGWELRDDGWHAAYAHAEIHHARGADAIQIEARWLDAADVEQLAHIDYRTVPRHDARTRNDPPPKVEGGSS